MARHFGLPNVTSRPASSGAQQLQAGSHSRAGQRDSNVVELFPSAIEAPCADDKNFAALWFGLVGLTCPFAIVGFAVTVYLLFFE